MKSNVCVYYLEDPGTEEIKYIGSTEVPLHKRLSAHLNEPTNKRKRQWLMRLKKKNKTPIIEEIDYCSLKQSKDIEEYWINHFRAVGCDLFNSTKKNMTQKNPVRFSQEPIIFWITKRRDRELKQMYKKTGIRPSEFVRRAIDHYLKRKP